MDRDNEIDKRDKEERMGRKMSCEWRTLKYNVEWKKHKREGKKTKTWSQNKKNVSKLTSCLSPVQKVKKESWVGGDLGSDMNEGGRMMRGEH